MERALELTGADELQPYAMVWIAFLGALAQATSALPAILASDRQLKEDYEALRAAANRTRK